MRKVRRTLVAVTIALALPLAGGCSCGGDDEALPDSGGARDGADIDGSTADAGPDAFVCPAPEPGSPGGACEADLQCDSAPDEKDGFCLTGEAGVRWPDEGFCIIFCVDDGECEDGSFCSALGGCVPECCEDESCSTGRICADRIFSDPLGGAGCVPGNRDAVEGGSCTTFGDCNQGSLCREDPFIFPGGFCQGRGCTVGDNSTCAPGGRCIEVGGGSPFCVPDCDTSADCREDEGYFCFDSADLGLGKFCTHAVVGDPCAVNTDCGTDPPWTCKPEEEGFPGGYCTIEGCTAGVNNGTCPRNSPCHTPGGEEASFCVTRCGRSFDPPCPDLYECVEIIPGGTPILGCLPE
jgi:hypothetical protein